MILLALNLTLEAQRGNRSMAGSNRMIGMPAGFDSLHKRGSGVRTDSLRMRNFNRGMRNGYLHSGSQFMYHRQVPGMQRGRGMDLRPGMGRGMRDQMLQGRGDGRGMGVAGRNSWGPVNSGRIIMESVPNVSEKQKKDIADLRLKQQDEMKKMREEMAATMQTLRDNHRKSILNILTEEQKKFIEAKQGNQATTPEKSK